MRISDIAFKSLKESFLRVKSSTMATNMILLLVVKKVFKMVDIEPKSLVDLVKM